MLPLARSPALATRRPPAGRLHPWRWAWGGAAAGLLVATLAVAPAAWLARGVARLSAQRVLLADPQGTVWRGSARLVLAGGADSQDATTLPSRVEWTLRPRWLGADVQLHSPCCTPAPLQLAVRHSLAGTRVVVADARLQLPSALLTGLGTPWNTLQPEGTLSLETRQVQLTLAQGRPGFQGALHLVLQEASTRLSTVSPIGSYAVDVTAPATPGTAAAPNPATLTLTTLPGSSLLLSGNGQWTDGRLHFSGEASATPERADALNNLLNIIGRRDGPRSVIRLG